MKKLLLSLAALAVMGGVGLGQVASAQTDTASDGQVDASAGEAIQIFDAEVVVNTDNSLSVKEHILYTTAKGEEKHGIYRDIATKSSQGRVMVIGEIEVTDPQGGRVEFETSHGGGNTRIKIGDPDETFTGEKNYVITYRASRAVGQFENFDEVYWDVTGNEWPMPIGSVGVTIKLPDGTIALQKACYYGPIGSTATCSEVQGIESRNPSWSGFRVANLAPGEGLTVAVGFPKGVVAAYTVDDNARAFLYTYGAWLLALLLPLTTLGFTLRHWYRFGRDPKGRGTIVPQYEVEDGLTPLEVVGIVKGRMANEALSAEIIYLATLGYIRVNQLTEKKMFGLYSQEDYELIKTKEGSDLPNSFDRDLMQSLFTKGDTIKISSLANTFYTSAWRINKNALDTLFTKGYYSNLGYMKLGSSLLTTTLFVGVFAALWVGGVVSDSINLENPLPLIVSIFLSVLAYGVVAYFFPAKSAKGVAAKEHILGLKDYLQIAEKDRINFHNAPEKKPELFEKFLPYAMALGVVGIWAKEFADLHMVPPSWYSGSASNMAAFNAVSFSHSLSSFSTAASSTLTSSPGSSGGGSSGGGGGGGGGGSW